MAGRELLAAAGLRIGASLFAGSLAPADGTWISGTIAGVLTLVVIALLGWRGGRAAMERRWLALAAGVVLACSLYRCRHVLPGLTHAGFGARYFFPPQLIVMWLLLSAVWDHRRWLAWAAMLACVWSVVVNIPRLREPGLPDRAWAAQAGRIRRGEAVTIPINPDQWAFTLPGHAARPPPSGLVNVSTRCWLTPDRPAIVGFVVQAGPSRTLLVRASGPTLVRFAVDHPAARPTLRLVNAANEERALEPAQDAAGAAAIADAAKRLGAFPLAPGSAEPAAIVELEPGSYSVIVSAEPGAGGEVLLEIFDLPATPHSGGQ